jgi:hypothetical protein
MTKPTATDFIREYLSRMADIRGTGGATKETSYYSALENLVNHFGEDLKPQVICNGQLRNDGVGNPDFGLYTRSQIQKGEPRKGQIPERGVVEVKGLAEHTWQTADSAQATKYFGHYRLVLVTNYREFRLIGEDAAGKAIELDKYTLADDESTFWAMTSKPSPAAHKHAAHFSEFIQRVLMTAAPLVKAEDIAWFLASYAKDALATLNEKDASSLKPLRDALEEALGLQFEGEDGDHFFKSTLIQTLFYGVFSAWVIHTKTSAERFDWKSAGYTLTVPMVKALFEQIATPTKLGSLGLIPVLDRTAQALHRVVKDSFFKTFDTGAAVQHFYEPFLQAYDPVLRKKLGVWYTPPEIVTYMVERVDRVLRSELGKPHGLADKDVFILDPCCGTGTYVVAVLRKIEETLRSQGADALLADDIKQAAKERVFGFELLSASFVTAHWRVGNYLSELGSPFDSEKGERAAIYLTNALTGWQPPTGPKADLPLFPELAEEREAAEHVKRDVPILVILGNPPYDGFAGTSPAEEAGLVEPYKEGLIDKWGIKKFNLDDLYVRFFRLAERRINELGRGIVAYISNYSYVSEPSYVVMREKLLQTFDKFWIENMHGDRKKTEYAPDGSTSETIFAMRGFSPGIRQGVVTALAVKTGKANAPKAIRYRDDIDAAKASARRAQLLETLNQKDFESCYELANPEVFNRYSFRPRKVTGEYKAWPSLENIALAPAENGLMEKRGGALIDINRTKLLDRMKIYFDDSISWDMFSLQRNPLSKKAGRFDPESTRKRLIHNEGFIEERIVQYFTRPFDFRYCYYSAVRPLWNEPRPELWSLSNITGNAFLISRPASATITEGVPFYFLRQLGDNDAIRGHAYYFPLRVYDDQGSLLGKTEITNLSHETRNYLEKLGFNSIDKDISAYSSPWWHALAIGFSPKYYAEHREGIAIGWPRIPMPLGREEFDRSAKLGKRLADLLDPNTHVATVTGGTIAEHQKVFGVLSATDLGVTAGWGHLDTKGRVNPGKGRSNTRAYTTAEQEAITKGIAAAGINKVRGFDLLGPPVDVYLNATTYWRCIPTAVWEYTIGGYQVVKKWLSYREQRILGRPLTKEEAREVTSMVRRLAAIVLMTDELNDNYTAARDDAFGWPLQDEVDNNEN